MKIEVRLANERWARQIADNLRTPDLREIRGLTSLSPVSAVVSSYRESRLCYVVLLDDEPVVIFGVSSVLGAPQDGLPWLLATPEITKIARRFLRESRDWIKKLWDAGPYNTLHNIADTRNETHIRWLKWVGARFSGPMIKTHYQYFEIPRRS